MAKNYLTGTGLGVYDKNIKEYIDSGLAEKSGQVFVFITDNGDETYTANKTYKELSDAFMQNNMIYGTLEVDDGTFMLLQFYGINETMIIFGGNMGSDLVLLGITSDNTVFMKQDTFALYSELMEQIGNVYDDKADKATTLSGYGITDAYTDTEVDEKISNAKSEVLNDVNEATNKILPLIVQAIEEGDDTTLSDSKSYTDEKVASISAYTQEEVDEKVDSALSEAKEYADTMANSALTVVQGLDATVLADSKSYTDEVAKTKVNVESGKGLSTNDYTTAEKEKLEDIEEGANKTIVDISLSSTSTNPVQNKVVNSALSGKVSTSTTVNGKALTGNITLSASDVGADASGSANTALTNAKAYADEVANGALAIVEANDATVLSESKSYTDEKVANLLENSTDAVDSIYELRDAMSDNADAISALQTIAGNKANASDLTSHTGSTSNPHGVTKSQVGLGNVPNVATNDQTPTFTVATTLATLTSGEKLSVAFGKISKAITDLASHIGNKSNPHGVTASQVGADASGSASKALADAKTYTDGKISSLSSYSKTEIDNMVFITTDDIDAICGTTIQVATTSDSGVTF